MSPEERARRESALRILREYTEICSDGMQPDMAFLTGLEMGLGATRYVSDETRNRAIELVRRVVCANTGQVLERVEDCGDRVAGGFACSLALYLTPGEIA